MRRKNMWALLIVGIAVVVVGFSLAIVLVRDHESNGIISVSGLVIALGILMIYMTGVAVGNRRDPVLPNIYQGHIYEVLDSMKFKKGYLVSFKEIIPKRKITQVRFFKKVPPSLFEAAEENGKRVYVPFEPPASNPVK